MADGNPVDIVSEPAGRAFAHEHRPGVGDPPGLGGQGRRPEDRPDARGAGGSRRAARRSSSEVYNETGGQHGGHRQSMTDAEVHRAGEQPVERRADGDAGVRRCERRGNQEACWRLRTCRLSGQTQLLRRPHRRAVRAPGDGGLHVHAEAQPPGRRQDARAFDRTVQPRDPAAAGRQGAVRRSALRRDGSLGARGLRRRLHLAGNVDRQVRRRERPHEDVQEHRRRQSPDGCRHAGVLQRAREGNQVAGHQYGTGARTNL